jgi:preprotein translocase subunit SecG
MQATFVQKVILTLVAAFFASCLVWFYKNIIQKGDDDINKNWRIPPPAATAHP